MYVCVNGGHLASQVPDFSAFLSPTPADIALVGWTREAVQVAVLACLAKMFFRRRGRLQGWCLKVAVGKLVL